MRAPGPLDSFGAVLSGLAKRLGLESRLLELRLQREWKRIVGEPVGSHTWPEQIRFKKLHLIVRNSVWMQQLTYLKPALLTKITDSIGTGVVTDLSLRVGEIPAGESPAGRNTSKVPQRPVGEDALTEASAHAASIQDPELRDHFTKMMAESLSRNAG